MGVPSFFRFVTTRYRQCVRPVLENPFFYERQALNPKDEAAFPEKDQNIAVDNLYLDLNGIIHTCSHPEDTEAPETEEEMIDAIMLGVDRVVSAFMPKKLIYFAVDGVAPRAKINQQRSRRFRAAAALVEKRTKHQQLAEEFTKQGRPVPPTPKTWDHNAITPGTPFMEKITSSLHIYIEERMARFSRFAKLKVILSDSRTPQEGEHEILKYIRLQRTVPDYDPHTSHVIFGPDADLIMLGLSVHEPKVYLCRPVAFRDRRNPCALCGQRGHDAYGCHQFRSVATLKATADSNYGDAAERQRKVWNPMQMVDISKLRDYLYYEFRFEGATTGIAKNFDKERGIDDFVFLCFFCGNDFLPHLHCLAIRDGSVDLLLGVYRAIATTLPDYLTTKGSINLESMQMFLDYVARAEPEILKQRHKKNRRRRDFPDSDQPQGRDRSRTKSDSADLIAAAENSPDIKLDILEDTSPVTRGNLGNLEQFNKILKERMNDDYEQVDDPVELGKGDQSRWRPIYYKNKFFLTDDDVLDEFVSRVVQEYMLGALWTMHYYSSGVVDWQWAYPFHAAPLAQDLARFLCDFKLPQFKLHRPLTPFQQLLTVLPIASKHCIPEELHWLMMDPNSPIADFYPINFVLDPDGQRLSWLWVPLMPFACPERLVKHSEPVEKALPLEVQARNATAVPICFLGPQHPFASEAANLTETFIQVEASSKFGSYGNVAKCVQLPQSGQVFTSPLDSKISFVSQSYKLSYDMPALDREALVCGFLPNAHHKSQISESELHDKRRYSGSGSELITKILHKVAARGLGVVSEESD